MIERIKDLPSNMVGFRAYGEITQDDFDNVIPEVEKLVDRTGKLNYLLFLDTSPADFTAGAWMQDAFLGLKNLLKWNRAAIVTDSEAIIKFTNAFSILMPGEFKGFHKNDMQEAIDWTSEKIQTT